MYDGQGKATWDMSLDSYGGVRRGQGRAQDCPFRYQGQYEDVETGLYYNRFRYYDPEAGQYVSQDPIRLQGGISLYGYVADVNNWLDVLGLSCEATIIAEQLKKGKAARVTVKSREEAEALLRELTSGRNHPGGYLNTTEHVIDRQAEASTWLPRPAGNKTGTYHWDDFNPAAKAGDHAIEGNHLQIHTFDRKIIRIFFP